MVLSQLLFFVDRHLQSLDRDAQKNYAENFKEIFLVGKSNKLISGLRSYLLIYRKAEQNIAYLNVLKS